ncbi:unnamed protein product, partial [Mesorhabditis spiculigera]
MDCCGLTSRAVVREDDQSIRINDDGVLEIDWLDGFQSSFTAEQLKSWGQLSRPVKSRDLHELWTGTSLKAMPRIPLDQLTVHEFTRLFIRYGFVLVDGVAGTAEATEKLCRELGVIHDTFFGAFWVFSNKSHERTDTEEFHEDTAYSSEGIGPHTDGTYFHQTPGIQVFHCLQPAPIGGETLLVDAFAAADHLKANDPAAFHTLTTQCIDHQYLEGMGSNDSRQLITRDLPVIELDTDGNYRQIRFNPYDRAPFKSLSASEEDAEKVVEFYRAYEAYSLLTLSPSRSLRISLQPGTVIFIDNFRLLHARTEFQGDRTMCGCYMSRDDILAKGRPFILPEDRRRLY